LKVAPAACAAFRLSSHDCGAGGAEGGIEPCCARAAMLNAATTVNWMLRDFFI
jgi:hypothetical protein